MEQNGDNIFHKQQLMKIALMVRACNEDVDGKMIKNYAGMEVERNRSTSMTTPQIDATYRLRNEQKWLRNI